jgi:hypothetical protein
MRLIYLHGPPAAGKYTIARELAARAGCGVFHNHQTIDVARSFFEFGSLPFWALVRELRLTCVRAVAAAGVRPMVYTSCYDHPADLEFYEELERIVHASGGALSPVYLATSVEELERRVSNPSRVEMGKLRSVQGLHAQLGKWNCVAVPRSECLTVPTDGRTAAECAEEIAARLGLRG